MLISVPKKILIELHTLFDGRFDRDLFGEVEDVSKRPLDHQNPDEKHIDQHLFHLLLNQLLEFMLCHLDVVHSVRLLVVASEPVPDKRRAWYVLYFETLTKLVGKAEQVVGDVKIPEIRVGLYIEKRMVKVFLKKLEGNSASSTHPFEIDKDRFFGLSVDQQVLGL